ncbi:hypothetical protein BO86DRAFT_402454 [Aspergillus japonicus CBS 114.51]|uniref:Uncharacterized protein n=1 Tax=Aspergillus japonicus CBS 114.51 TaxID=1448312 RepID=A0A8T8WSF1_ASPJA|nr:hypothetical protein BO86DRAFT_402454 [Aspergillus japonicus CBS 114.51]RAH78775.1 hypothetical protein BO86DRAFT_402454 [Aspergillus japonicus CBS 114.51]
MKPQTCTILMGLMGPIRPDNSVVPQMRITPEDNPCPTRMEVRSEEGLDWLFVQYAPLVNAQMTISVREVHHAQDEQCFERPRRTWEVNCRIFRQAIMKWWWLYVMMGCCATPLELKYDDTRQFGDQNRDWGQTQFSQTQAEDYSSDRTI